MSEDSFMLLGKPLSYWIELDRIAKTNMYEELITENAKMRVELSRLYSVERKYVALIDSMKKLGMEVQDQMA